MKINFKNKAARLKPHNHGNSCVRCPFSRVINTCPWHTSTIIDCHGKGYWVYGELIDVFKI